MKKIKLNHRILNDLYTLVSNEDFNELNRYKWHLGSQGYVRTQISRGRFAYMHKLVNKTPETFDTDHINRDKLDNRRENLRTATRSLNTRNSPLRIDNTSGHKGIDFYKRIKKWRVRVGAKGLGYFANLEEAITAREIAERKMGWIK